MLETRIIPRVRDLGDGFQVRRALPDARRRSVGPFVFFDQMGPTMLELGRGLDVRPHPHIGLATVTWLFEGEILHRDSLGFVQPIRAGEVNWMTAGRGIAHSERSPEALRASGHRLFGIQTWVALPEADEECEPAFAHHDRLPVTQESGVTLTLILGDLFGLSSPVATFSPIFYAEVELAGGRDFALPAKHEERGLYTVQGEIELPGSGVAGPGELLVFEPGAEVIVRARDNARFMIFGGAPLERPRFVWWNFVSSRRERIEQAAEDWKAGRFATVPGETEFIPLPAVGPSKGTVHYP
jgi:redox-sensitive bicupin YhaK (pirin superfamily)